MSSEYMHDNNDTDEEMTRLYEESDMARDSVHDFVSNFQAALNNSDREEAQRVITAAQNSQSQRIQEEMLQNEQEALNNVPHEFKCPISLEIMEEPVVASDGYTYNKNHIERWLEEHNTSPHTRERLAHRHLYPNQLLRNQINEWLTQHDQPQLQPPSQTPSRTHRRTPRHQRQNILSTAADWEYTDEDDDELFTNHYGYGTLRGIRRIVIPLQRNDNRSFERIQRNGVIHLQSNVRPPHNHDMEIRQLIERNELLNEQIEMLSQERLSARSAMRRQEETDSRTLRTLLEEFYHFKSLVENRLNTLNTIES